MATIASMVFNIEAQTASIEQSLGTVKKQLDDLDGGMLSTITSGVALGEMFDRVGEQIAAGFMAALSAVPDLIAHTIEVGNQLYEMSLKTGASVETLSALRYVASQTGVDFDAFSTTLVKMEQALGATGAKADAVAKSVGDLGLDMQTLKDEKPDQAFIDILSALEQMPNRADQASIGIQLFGKGFKEMAGLTQESITDLIQEAQDLGLVMGTDQAAAAHAAQVGWNAFTMQLESAAMAIAAQVLPALIALEGLARDAFKQLSDSVGPASGVSGSIAAMGETIIVATAAMAGFIEGSISGLRSVGNFALSIGDAMVAIAKLDPTKNLTGAAADIGRVSSVLDSLRSGLNTAADAGTKVFASVEQIADSMSGRFKDAYDAAMAKVQDFASKSHSAWGGVGADVDDGSAGLKQYQKALEDLESAGSSWRATLETIDGDVVEAVKYYLDAGVSASTLGTVYDLTRAQVDALVASHNAYKQILKDVQKVEDDKNQNSMEWIKKLGDARSVDSLQQMHDTVTSIDQTKVLWTQYYDTLGQLYLTDKDKKIAAVQQWADDETLKLKADDLNWLNHYNAIQATAQAKIQQIIQLNNPLFQSWQQLNKDMQGGWQTTFDSALASTHSFADAAKAVFDQFEVDLIKIFADILTNVIQGFLKPLEVQFGTWLAGVLGIASGGGGSSAAGGILSGLLGGGGHGGSSDPGDQGDSPGADGPPGGFGGNPGGSNPNPGGNGSQTGFSTGGFVPLYAAMGFPGAPSGTDTVPAWLTPGEMVLNRRQQQSLFGGGGSGGDVVINNIVTLDGKTIYRNQQRYQKGDLQTRRKLRAA